VTIVTAGTCTVTATKAGDGNYNPGTASAPFSITINKAATTITALSIAAISPNPTPQFGDTVTLAATVSPAVAGTVSFQLNGKPTTPLTATVSNGVATATLKLDSTVIPNGAGSYTLSASFAPTSTNYAAGSGSASVAVQREGQAASGLPDGSSRIDPSGKQWVAVGSAPTLTATLLQGLAPETGDAAFVDYSAVTVNAVFSVYPAGCATTCPTAATWTSASTKVAKGTTWATDGKGTVSVTAPNTLAEGSYIVVVTVPANGYVLPLRETSTLTVGSTAGIYVNGNGYVAKDSTSNAPNAAGMFGFNVKNGTSAATGSVAYVYRVRMDVSTSTATNLVQCAALSATCRDVDVLIRSSSVNNIVPGTATSSLVPAYDTGKATVQFVDATDGTRYSTFEFSGADFRLDAAQYLTDDTKDTFGLTVYRPATTTVFHQAFIPATSPISQTGLTVATNQTPVTSGEVVAKTK
jgi:hypothetical protein